MGIFRTIPKKPTKALETKHKPLFIWPLIVGLRNVNKAKKMSGQMKVLLFRIQLMEIGKVTSCAMHYEIISVEY